MSGAVCTSTPPVCPCAVCSLASSTHLPNTLILSWLSVYRCKYEDNIKMAVEECACVYFEVVQDESSGELLWLWWRMVYYRKATVWTVWGLNPSRTQEIFVSLKIFRLALGPTQPPILFTRGKKTEAWCWLLTSISSQGYVPMWDNLYLYLLATTLEGFFI